MAAPIADPQGGPKRPRPESTTMSREILVISSDEDEPPPKRQKSTTPIVNGINGNKEHVAKGKLPQPAKQYSGKPSDSPSASFTTTSKKRQNSDDIVFKPTHKNSVFKNVPQRSIKYTRGPYETNSSTARGPTQGTPRKQASSSVSGSKEGYHQPIHPIPEALHRTARRSLSPADGHYVDSSGDDLKILKNFKITEQSKQDRLRPQEPPAPPATLSVRQPKSQQRNTPPPRRDNLRPDAAHRSAYFAASPDLVDLSRIHQPKPKRWSTPPAQSGPSHSSVASPSTRFDLIVSLSQDALGGTERRSKPVPFIVDKAKEKEALLRELKESTEPVRSRPAEVEKYFGPTGFSPSFSTGDDEIRLKALASKKQRKVKRKHIKLDWGDPPPTSARDDEDANSHDSSVSLVHPTLQVKQMLTARFQEPHNPPLTFANDINDRRLNGKFQFVDRYVYSSGVRTASPATYSGCSCIGLCDPSTCSCLNHQVKDKNFQSLQIQPYEQRPDGLVVLSDIYMINELTPTTSHFEILECNTCCGCSSSCFNKVITRGRTVPLEIFETAKCGFGVRSPVDIVKGQFIDLYLGEVITQQELERRESAKEENASSYIYSLDWFTQQNCYHVDSENFGTAMRFVNHNCNPNARNFTVQTSKGDKHVYYLAFFAIKDIPAGTEISIDYSPQEEGKYVDSDDGHEGFGEDGDEQEGRARCYCGAENCRKFLWRSAGRKRRKRKTMKHD